MEYTTDTSELDEFKKIKVNFDIDSDKDGKTIYIILMRMQINFFWYRNNYLKNTIFILSY